MFNGKDEEIRELLAENSELWEENTSVKNKLFKQQEKIDKAIELTKNLLETEDRGYYQIIFKEILKSLGDKENER